MDGEQAGLAIAAVLGVAGVGWYAEQGRTVAGIKVPPFPIKLGGTTTVGAKTKTGATKTGAGASATTGQGNAAGSAAAPGTPAVAKRQTAVTATARPKQAPVPRVPADYPGAIPPGTNPVGFPFTLPTDETATQVARAYGVSVAALAAANPGPKGKDIRLHPNRLLAAGNVLFVPAPRP